MEPESAKDDSQEIWSRQSPKPVSLPGAFQGVGTEPRGEETRHDARQDTEAGDSGLVTRAFD